MAPKIAWIEDDISIIYPVIKPMKKAGYEIIEMQTIPNDVDSINELRDVDLIILDMIMVPSSDKSQIYVHHAGMEFLNRLRKEHEIDTPVVILSVVTHIENLKAISDELNIVDVITKPVMPKELKDRIDKCLENKKILSS